MKLEQALTALADLINEARQTSIEREISQFIEGWESEPLPLKRIKMNEFTIECQYIQDEHERGFLPYYDDSEPDTVNESEDDDDEIDFEYF